MNANPAVVKPTLANTIIICIIVFTFLTFLVIPVL